MTKEQIPASRIASIDIMRGLVIILMMLDHVRERFYMHVRTGDPIADTIEPDLFFTRMLTHLCAPVFIFLAGMSAWLYAHPREGEYRSPSKFLFKRGLVIILIELLLYYLVWADSFPNYLFLQVLWAIGLCMVALSVACRFNYWLIGALGFLIILGHNFLVPINFQPGELGYVPWAILHDGGELGQIGPLTISLSYPSLPWFGVILLGYFAGPLFARSTAAFTRRRWLIGLGASCLALLLVLRGLNIYGETIPWSVQETTIETVMSFINFTKYPPSLDYILLTLGIGLLMLAGLETVKKQNWALDLMQTFGSIPMFIYVLHLYVLLAAYWILYTIFGATQGERYGLDSVFWIWVGALVLIAVHYPIAKVFAAYKHREKRNKPWLSYF
ncbi:heparan-alpha-glucosaminide N-acetyltransferase domain-containing protein [Sphingorhabdus sp. Alg231-15]|uniref:heparan-alpha-glucosaminide N-acetyltransferase domain-containing protein n=1 Tax=Sphingorhabdus sp. Alg231-15 TaxID=1922222 RepID=UPI000D54B347